MTSVEWAAYVVGVSLSTFPYNLDVIAKIISLRDFFITLFFVTLGARIPRPTLDILVAAVATSAFLVVSRFLSITPVLSTMKMGLRTSFIPALNLAQISEFSLVIGAIGVNSDHIDSRFLLVLIYVMVITSVGSTYAIMKNHEIFVALRPVFRKLGIRDLGEKPRSRRRNPAMTLCSSVSPTTPVRSCMNCLSLMRRWPTALPLWTSILM